MILARPSTVDRLPGADLAAKMQEAMKIVDFLMDETSKSLASPWRPCFPHVPSRQVNQLLWKPGKEQCDQYQGDWSCAFRYPGAPGVARCLDNVRKVHGDILMLALHGLAQKCDVFNFIRNNRTSKRNGNVDVFQHGDEIPAWACDWWHFGAYFISPCTHPPHTHSYSMFHK